MIGAMMLVAVLGDPAGARPTCAVIAAAVPAAWHCVQTSGGLIVAKGRERADALAALATQGETRFRTAFDRSAPSYAVIEMIDGRVDPALDALLARKGVVWRLPWLSETDMAEGYRGSIRRAVTAKAESLKFDAARTAAMVEAALAQQADRLSPEALRRKEAAALPHELGHGWFINSYWPKAEVRVSDHYGGPAPDWMDETAAVMMEDDATAATRRARFAEIYRGGDADAKAKLIDLSTFLSGGHPALPKIALPKDGARVQVLTGDEGARVAAAASGFYLQARLFADYVGARSGRRDAFRSVAEAFAKGQTTAQWLADSGTRSGLPTTVAGVQQDWERWLAERFAARG
ncbi:hypothetical protein ASE86_06600 [Sphingomonas sp. Leaf33]|uniref:hypothetical protein n=1 Tax=Sphingomonas sp. Leaf33 TaxID=1736215 RepID=UPI00071281C0|nr:hypothetical protein [Sphingomonas sp. Leaf33]KQN25862.1 hypothetical protein ASE86_06600 [Sphingomonas sp. Leaf33]